MTIHPRFRRVLAAAFLPAAFSASGIALGTTQQPRSAEAIVTKRSVIPYLLYEPIAGRRAQLPVILYLHSERVRGDDVNSVRSMGLPRLLESTNSFPFIVVSPRCPPGEIWSDVDAIDAVLEEALKLPRADRRRVYVVGDGMGGRGALYAAFKHPERFTAVIAAGAEAPMESWAPRLARVPIWYLHGAKDASAPVGEADALVHALQSAGSDVKYTRFEQRDHSMVDVFEDQTTYRWLLQFSGRDRDRNLL
ncbi:MAG: carboxylesterase family protein [Usitatibacter sp.]